jgi:hypothetical protein
MSCGCKARARKVLSAFWGLFPISLDSARRDSSASTDRTDSEITLELPAPAETSDSPVVAAEKRGRFAFTRKRKREVTK